MLEAYEQLVVEEVNLSVSFIFKDFCFSLKFEKISQTQKDTRIK